MQFFFGWIAGMLTAGVWFGIWWIEQTELPGLIEECPPRKDGSHENRD